MCACARVYEITSNTIFFVSASEKVAQQQPSSRIDGYY